MKNLSIYLFALFPVLASAQIFHYYERNTTQLTAITAQSDAGRGEFIVSMQYQIKSEAVGVKGIVSTPDQEQLCIFSSDLNLDTDWENKIINGVNASKDDLVCKGEDFQFLLNIVIRDHFPISVEDISDYTFLSESDVSRDTFTRNSVGQKNVTIKINDQNGNFLGQAHWQVLLTGALLINKEKIFGKDLTYLDKEELFDEGYGTYYVLDATIRQVIFYQLNKRLGQIDRHRDNYYELWQLESQLRDTQGNYNSYCRQFKCAVPIRFEHEYGPIH